jgi:hypothetical protein
MRGFGVLLVILALTGLGCGSTKNGSNGGGRASKAATQTVDGLTRTEIDAPGVLFIRDDHGIGSYDAFLIPEATISYRRRSVRLPTELELAFMASLEQTLIDAAQEADIPIVQTPGNCVLQVAMGLTDVDIERSKTRSIGRLTLVMEFRDTLSGQPLLRYATRNTIEREGTDVPRSEQIGVAFDEMVGEMEIAGALRAAGLGADTIRPGCEGTLSKRGGNILPAVSTE